MLTSKGQKPHEQADVADVALPDAPPGGNEAREAAMRELGHPFYDDEGEREAPTRRPGPASRPHPRRGSCRARSSVAHFRRHVQPGLKLIRSGSCRLGAGRGVEALGAGKRHPAGERMAAPKNAPARPEIAGGSAHGGGSSMNPSIRVASALPNAPIQAEDRYRGTAFDPRAKRPPARPLDAAPSRSPDGA